MATPKTMSNRLMTMKFMQRAAASPSPADEPPNKKQRLSTDRSEAKRYAAAIAAEEQKRTEAVEREAAARGETKWYLSYEHPHVQATETPLRVQSAGFSILDTHRPIHDDDSDTDDESQARPAQGRKSFGKFNRKLERQQNPDLSSSSDDEASDADEEREDDDDADVSDDPTGVKALIAQGRKDAAEQARAERKARKKAENAESVRLAEERRKSKINLNKLNSISGGGNAGRKSPNLANTTCHMCGGKGHLQRDCPKKASQRQAKSRLPY